MTTVVATGTFEILHPGHMLFLKEAKKLGDKLFVIISTDRNATREKGRILIPQEQRLEMVKALKFVDNAVIGDEKDMFRPIVKIKPDIIALGRDQRFRENELEAELKKRGIDARVVRIKKFLNGGLNSSSRIVERIKGK